MYRFSPLNKSRGIQKDNCKNIIADNGLKIKSGACRQEVLSSLDSKIDLLHRQNKTLENMRDTLLPKLMSGEVRVKNG